MKTTGSQFSAEALDQFPDVAASAGEAAKSKSFDNASQCDTSTNTEQLKISQQPVSFIWTYILFSEYVTLMLILRFFNSGCCLSSQPTKHTQGEEE